MANTSKAQRGVTRFTISLSRADEFLLLELAWQNRMTKAEVMRLLIREAAKRVGLTTPDDLPAVNASDGDSSDRRS